MIGAAAESFYRRTIAGAYGLDVSEPMSPSMRNRYSRLTLVSRQSPERTTTDFDLHVLRGETIVGSMGEDVVLIETKSADGRGQTDRILWHLGVHPLRVSKYCSGISLLHTDLGVNRYARALRAYFAPSTRSSPGRLPGRVPAPAPPRALEGPPRTARPIRPVRPPRPARALR